jgi:hypothetical protein
MSKLTAYFQALQKQMTEDFGRIRRQINDRDAKGHENEKALGDFLNKYIPDIDVRRNVEIMDHEGRTSGEMDICACNRFQLARNDALLLSQGVDFVVQVKAVLTGAELVKIQQNAVKLKSLVRAFTKGADSFFAHRSAVPFTVARIPYFVFAYESALTTDTAMRQWQLLLEQTNTPPELQPEGIFILNRDAILRINPTDGSYPSIRTEAYVPEWYTATFDSGTLLGFINSILQFGRAIRHIQNPLSPYMAGLGITGNSVGKSYGVANEDTFLERSVWEQILALLSTLNKSECINAEIKEECSRRKKTAEACLNGDFPSEAFEVVDVDTGVIITIDDELLAEIRNFLRFMTGKDPAISPSPRIGTPFNLQTRDSQRSVSVQFRKEFVEDLQTWCIKNCSFFQQSPRRN